MRFERFAPVVGVAPYCVRPLALRTALLLSLATLTGPSFARDTRPAAVHELHVVTSGGFTTAFAALAKQYERETGVHIITEHGPSMGDTPQAIPARLARHEDADVVIWRAVASTSWPMPAP